MYPFLNTQKILARLKRELENSCDQLEKAENRLLDKNFVSKAPAHIIQGAKETVEKLQNKIKNLNRSISELSEK